MFLRVVVARNICTLPDCIYIRFIKRSSSAGSNVAVNITMGTWALFNSPNSYNRGRKSSYSFNTTWHSLITIRSNRSCPLIRFINRINSSLQAPSGVTSTILALSGGRRRFYSRQSIPISLYLRRKSWYNAIDGTITYIDRLIFT